MLPSFTGTQIVYGLTIPGCAARPEEAALLVEFLLGPDGRRVFEQSYHPLWSEPACDRVHKLPEALRPWFAEGRRT